MVTPVMQDEKYASVGQLIELAKKKRHNDMLYLLGTMTYSRYAISLHRKELLANEPPMDVQRFILDYHDSAMSTL